MAIRKRDEQRERGLPSLNEARLERRRAIVFGRARLPALPPYFWLWLGIGLAAFGVLYWRIVEGELETKKSAVMAKQRAIAQTLGQRLLPLRDQIETWVHESAGAYRGDYVAPGTSLEHIRRAASVYLRLRRSSAATPRSIRQAAQSSLRDGFTSCLFISPAPAPASPERQCRSAAECEPGFLCNEYGLCARPAQPYNLRLAYRALRVLSNEWSDELHQAGSDLAVAAYDRDLDAVTRNDVPIAIELLSRAQYFTLVLDEEPPGTSLDAPDAGESPDEVLQRTRHAARIGIWDLKTRTSLVRFRAETTGSFVPVGDRVVKSQETLFAEQRQANNCALALELKSRLAREQPAAGSDVQR